IAGSCIAPPNSPITRMRIGLSSSGLRRARVGADPSSKPNLVRSTMAFSPRIPLSSSYAQNVIRPCFRTCGVAGISRCAIKKEGQPESCPSRSSSSCDCFSRGGSARGSLLVGRRSGVLLVIRHRLVLRFGEVGGVLGFAGRGLVRLGLLVGIALRRRRRQLGVRGGECADHERRKRRKHLFHGYASFFMCGAPAGTAPPAGSRWPDLTSRYQISWCSLAQVSSVTPWRMLP